MGVGGWLKAKLIRYGGIIGFGTDCDPNLLLIFENPSINKKKCWSLGTTFLYR